MLVLYNGDNKAKPTTPSYSINVTTTWPIICAKPKYDHVFVIADNSNQSPHFHHPLSCWQDDRVGGTMLVRRWKVSSAPSSPSSSPPQTLITATRPTLPTSTTISTATIMSMSCLCTTTATTIKDKIRWLLVQEGRSDEHLAQACQLALLCNTAGRDVIDGQFIWWCQIWNAISTAINQLPILIILNTHDIWGKRVTSLALCMGLHWATANFAKAACLNTYPTHST